MKPLLQVLHVRVCVSYLKDENDILILVSDHVPLNIKPLHQEVFLICISLLLVIKTGSSGLIAYRWCTKDFRWLWLQSSCKVIYKNSKPDFVICTHRQLTYVYKHCIQYSSPQYYLSELRN